MQEPITDPQQVPVQLNVMVPFEFREHLRKLSQDRHVSLNKLCREALFLVYPNHQG